MFVCIVNELYHSKQKPNQEE
eukprot:COSAG02_NODE_39987_length_410_cov_1.000000_1_plen_20_part_01